MNAFTHTLPPDPVPRWRSALYSIAVFWLFYFAITSGRSFFYFDDPWAMFPRRTAVVFAGALCTALAFVVISWFEGRSIRQRLIVMFVISVPLAIAYSAFNHFFFYVIAPMDALIAEMELAEKELPLWEMIFGQAFNWYWFFVAWGAFYLALSYADDVRAAERRVAMWRAEAQSAQIRALRYQINPHFLFNTLNSLSSLILSKRNEQAEEMLLSLSTFLRTTLSGDPEEPVSLEEEIEQQRLYLEIERARFGERLRFDIDVPPDAAAVMVPPMILQPIIENAVRYAVAPSKEPVCIRIEAIRAFGRLEITVSDTGAEAAPIGDHGLGTGLRNVRDRLRAAYGDEARLDAGPGENEGFKVRLSWPLGPEG